MEHLHIQPSELEKMQEHDKWLYYYYVIAVRECEFESMKNNTENGRNPKSDSITFPNDFISRVKNKQALGELKHS